MVVPNVWKIESKEYHSVLSRISFFSLREIETVSNIYV